MKTKIAIIAISKFDVFLTEEFYFEHSVFQVETYPVKKI